MNYQRIYDQIIERAKLENREKGKSIYYEAHHIIPKCLGGDGSVKNWRTHSNIVLLTPREHFLCHWLLHEIYPDNKKLAVSFYIMCVTENNQQTRHRPSSRVVEYAKVKNSIARKNQIGFWKGKNLSEETKEKIRLANIGKKQSKETLEKRHLTKVNNGSYEIQAKKLQGRVVSEETKIKQRLSMKGFKHSEEAKQLMRKPKSKKTCPHCGKIGAEGAMNQHHFDNCKNNKNAQ